MQALLRRSGFWLVACVGFGLGLGCKSPNSSPAPEKPRPAAPARARAAPIEPIPSAVFEPGNAEHGKALVAQFECHRCHAGTGMAAPKLDQDCVGCHEQIATDKFQAASSKLAKWKPHILPYRDVPSLTDLGARLRPAWVRDYLLHPHDLRPNLAQTMPRLALSPEQATRTLAKVGDRVITLGDFAATLERMDQFDRLRYQTKERRKELLDEIIAATTHTAVAA